MLLYFQKISSEIASWTDNQNTFILYEKDLLRKNKKEEIGGEKGYHNQELKILNYIPDYRIHLIDPARLTKEQLELFQTSLREVLGCIKYAKDKKRLKEYITENARMYMENAAAQVIKAITNTPITISEEEEEIDVCQAVDEMIEEGREEGRMEGFIKAYALKDGLLSVKEAASRMHMTEEKFVEEMEKVDKRS